MRYVDGFLVPVPTKNLQAYRRVSAKAGKVWREHGALDYKECAADDMTATFGVPFTKVVKLKAGETVLFSWIVFKSKAHRNRVNAKAMKDPRLTGPALDAMPFDVKRMAYGGFKVLVG